MTETPIKIPKWLSARVYNLNLVPDAVGYDEMRHYSAEDIVWLPCECTCTQVGSPR